MKIPDYLDFAEFHARGWFDGHGLPTEPMLCICDGEDGIFTRSVSCSVDVEARAALRRELRAAIIASEVMEAFLMSPVRVRGDAGEELGSALIIVTYEPEVPDRSRWIPLVAADELMPNAVNIPVEQVYSPFPNLLTGLHQDMRKGPGGLMPGPR